MKFNYFLVAFLLLSTSITVAQESSRWSISAEYSVDFINYSRNGSNGDVISVDGQFNSYSVDFNQYNYSTGLATSFRINNRLKLTSGVLYSNKDFEGIYSCGTCFGPVFPPEIINQRYLSIPVIAEYSFLNSAIQPVVQTGIRNNIKVQNDIERASNDYFMELVVGASIRWNISSLWEIQAGYNYLNNLTQPYFTDEVELETNSYFLRIGYRL